jgi:phosphoserine aminotransferase
MTTMTAPAAHAFKTASGRKFNFSAGPGILPEEVLHQAQKDLWDIAGSGIGILEHSHRGPVFDKVLAEAEAIVREVGSVPDDYAVMFVPGGVTLHFGLLPMNFVREKSQVLDYFMTGKWADDATKEAQGIATVNIAGSSKATNHDRIPAKETWKFSKDAVYCHSCSNNTIEGTQWKEEPVHPFGAPLICDTSSDMFSRPIDVRKYGMIYAGAQKNLGPSGIVLFIAEKKLVEKGRDDLSVLLKYKTHMANESRYNTPNTFGIYLIGEVCKWIKRQGGLKAMEQRNNDKAAVLYNFLDSTSFYKAHAQKADRSPMNVTFRCPTEDLDKKFCKESEARGLDGLKGHRAVGGMRASIYNAFPVEGVRALVDFMKEFERANGGK